MNNKRKKLLSAFSGRNGMKNLAISIVILVEIIAILTVATFAWVETVSSIKIATRNANNQEDPLVIDSYVFTEAMIGEGKGTIDLADYFKKAGDMHFAPCSSADGEKMFFPKVTNSNTAKYEGSPNSTVVNSFRKGDSSDKNTAYMSISFKLKADVNADFFFTEVPTITLSSAQTGNTNFTIGPNIRVSVTAYTEGMSHGDLYDATGKPKFTQIYANDASTTPVVGNTSGTTAATTVESFANHIKGKGSTAKLFSVAADETKIVTINVWLQYPNIAGYQIPTDIPGDISISNFGIISDLTPRHVTLIPTNRWDTGGTAYYYAWCWMGDKSIASRLYKLSLDDNEHYSFDYNGKYDNTLFFKSSNSGLTTDNMSSHWNSTTILFKSIDTAIPSSPVDPTFVITELRGGDADNDLGGAKKSKGVWALPDIVTIKTAFVTGQSSSWGTLSSTSYYGTTVTSSQQVEANNSSSTTAKHHDTIHALPGKKVELNATVKSTNYAFVGWYDNAAGTGNALSTSATYNFNASTEAPKEIVYYAKFKEVRQLTIVKYLDGAATTSTTAANVGSITIGTNTSNANVTSYAPQYYDKGTSVSFSATASTGYTLSGIYTTATGSTTATSPVTLNDNLTYYARFTTNTHTVNLRTIGSTGSTVQYGNETAATSVTKTGVKYNTSVTIKANPAAGYKFVGWYTNSSGTGTAASTNASYTFTLGDADVTYYAKFQQADYYLTGYINGGDVSGTTHKFTAGSNGVYTYTYKFTGGSDQWVTIYDGTNAYHPGTHGAGSGTAANTSLTDTTPAGPNGNKWNVAAPKGATVEFTWNSVNKTLSWSITSRELYLKPNSNWTQSSARFAAYVYGNGEAWYSMTSAGSGYYKVTVPASYPNVIFARMNGSTSTNNWSNKWNQTGDLTIPADKNCFTVPDGVWDGSTTTWSLY